jgi:hypothetical protein
MSIRPAKRANSQTKNYAKNLRANATVPEKLLWSALRGRRLTDLKFRRQHPMNLTSQTSIVRQHDWSSSWMAAVMMVVPRTIKPETNFWVRWV